MSSGGNRVQMSHPPKGSFWGTPSSVTSARLAPDPAIPRRDTPCDVGFAPKLEVRRKSETPGTCARASSSLGAVSRAVRSSRMIEKAASAGLGGRLAALTTTTSTVGGWSAVTRPLAALAHPLAHGPVWPASVFCSTIGDVWLVLSAKQRTGGRAGATGSRKHAAIGVGCHGGARPPGLPAGQGTGGSGRRAAHRRRQRARELDDPGPHLQRTALQPAR